MSRESLEQTAREYAALCEATAARLDELEAMPPGAELAAACAALQTEPLDAAGAVRLTALWDRVSSWVSAQTMVSFNAAMDATDAGGSLAATSMIAELAVASHVSEASMSLRAGLVSRVATALPLSWQALNAGQLSLAHVKALDAELTGASARVAAAVEAVVLPAAIAEGRTPHQVRVAAGKALLRVDPDGCAERAAAARRDESDVTYRRWCDGLAAVTATGDQVTLRQVHDAIDASAREMRRAGDTRPVGMRRVDALAAAVLGSHPSPRVEIGVTVDLPTLLGLADNPGEIAGVGPVPAELVRSLAADADWRRWLTEPTTGRLLDLGHRSYRPSAALRRLVDAEHRTCRFPGCSRRAVQCDCDHRQEWPYGPTDQANLHPLCRKHHNLKTAKLWRVEVNPDGSETWTSRLGFSYTVPAARHTEAEWLQGLDPPDDLDDLPESDAPPPNDPQPPPTGWWEQVQPPPLADDELDAITRAIDSRFFTDDADHPEDVDFSSDLRDAWDRIAEEHLDRILAADRAAWITGELAAMGH